MVEPSFADVFKLMTEMNSFETLLDATALSPDVCVKLGIHDQLKHLYEKLGKHIQHDEINDLNNQNVSSLGGDERKVLDLNMKSSSISQSHNTDNTSEFLNNSVKNMETKKLNENVGSDIPNATVGNLIDFDINPDIFGSYKLLKSSAEVYNIAAKTVELDARGQNISPDLKKETAILQPVEYNNILKDLLKPISNDNAFSGNHKANSPFTCQQHAFCDNKDDKLSGLKETLLNKIQESGACSMSSTSGIKPLLPPGVLFLSEPAGNQPEGFGKQSTSRRKDHLPQVQQHKNVRGEQKKNFNKFVAATSPQVQSINVHVHMQPYDVPPPSGTKRAGVQKGRDKNYNPTNENNLEKLRTRALEYREEVQLMWKMVKEAEGMNNRRGNFSRVGNRYRCNICSTGTLVSSCHDVVKHVQSVPHLHNLQLASLNLEKLRTRALEYREEVQLMWKMVKDVEGVNNRRDNFSKVGNQHRCHVCNTGPILSSCYELVKHAWSVEHLDNLQLASSAKSNTPQSKSNARDNKDPRNRGDNSKETLKSIYEKNMELLRLRSLDANEEFALLRKMVRKVDGEHWRRNNFAKHDDDSYVCNICGIVLNGPFQLMEHVRGNSHRNQLTGDDESD